MDKNIKNTIQNKQTMTESGRSMVEMLGVLAVVGVLSVGGIVGYTHAMDKYYTNELLNGASERAVLITAQLVSTGNATLPSDVKNETSAGTFSSIEVYDDSFGIIVTGVKGSVCENLISVTANTNIVMANEAGEDLLEGDCSDDELNNVMFVFENGIGGGNDGFEHCPEYGACVTCSGNQEVRCSSWDEHCVCIDPNKPNSWACGDAKCISNCPDDTTAYCADYNVGMGPGNPCICVPNSGAVKGVDWGCDKMSCALCLGDNESVYCSNGDGCWCETSE